MSRLASGTLKSNHKNNVLHSAALRRRKSLQNVIFMVGTGKAESQSLLFKMKIKISIRCKVKRRGFGAKNGDIYKLLEDVIYCIIAVNNCWSK